MKTKSVHKWLIVISLVMECFDCYAYKYHNRFSYQFNNKQQLKSAQKMYLMIQNRIKQKMQTKSKTQLNNRLKLQSQTKIGMMNKHKQQSKYQIINDGSQSQSDDLVLNQEQQMIEDQMIQKYIDKQSDSDIKDQSNHDDSVYLDNEYKPNLFQVSLQIQSLVSDSILSPFSQKYMASNKYGVYYMDVNNYEQDDIAQYSDSQQIQQLYTLQDQLCFNVKDQPQEQMWIICGNRSTINQFYQQTLNNQYKKDKYDDNDMNPIKSIQSESNLCQSDQQVQSPIPLTMLFSLQDVDTPVFKYHGSKNIKIMKQTNEYSFDSDFGRIIFNNQSYCAWRIEIKQPAEHELPKIKQVIKSQIDLSTYKDQSQDGIMEIVVYHTLNCNQNQKEQDILKQEGQLLISFFIFSQESTVNSVGVFWTSLINYDLQKGSNEQINIDQNNNDYPLPLDLEALVDEGISIAFPLSFYQYQGSLSIYPCSPCQRLLFYSPIYLHSHLFQSIRDKLRTDFRNSGDQMDIQNGLQNIKNSGEFRSNSRQTIHSNMNENVMVWRWVDPKTQMKRSREMNQIFYQNMPINIYSSVSRKIYKLKKNKKQRK